MEEVKKFQDLIVGETYIVQSYHGPYNSRYGISYILNITNAYSSDVALSIWSTNLLAEYISIVGPDRTFSLFSFTVSLNEWNNKKYPVIPGFIKERNFTLLTSNCQ